MNKVSVAIDSNAWDFLFKRRIDLSVALPPEEFAIFITREVEIELGSIPDEDAGGGSKLELKRYILEAKKNHLVKTTRVFGFAMREADGTLSKAQVYGGFSQGTFQSEEDRNWYLRPDIQRQLCGKKKRPTGLGANQADASLGARSFNSFVLTVENPNKSGPLKIAAASGGKIVYLGGLDASGLSLRDYILRG